MKVISKGTIGLTVALCVALTAAAFAQWPDDPSINMGLSLTTGEATVPHIVPTSDGGCYVSWWDNTPGHYCMYMQRLNANGEIMWEPNGKLISDHPQDTWLTDYTLAVDDHDCAILAINDTRAGGDWDIYAYRLNEAGDFLWGANGLTISNDANSDAFPQVLVTGNGNVVFAWNDISAAGVVRMRKVDINGNDLWSPAIKSITSTYGVGYPRLVRAENDGMILQLVVHTGSGYTNPWHMYAHKYDSLGTDLWGSSGVLINSASSVQIYMSPDIISDNAGGAFSFWYDERSMVLHCYAQHITSTGAMAWTANGVAVSTAAGQIQVSPDAFYNSATNELILFYLNKNTDQNQWGVYGQKYNSSGVRQWTNNALALAPLSTQERGYVLVDKLDSGAVVTYFEKPAGEVTNAYVKAIRINRAGTPLWSPQAITMCSTLSSKDKLVTCINPFGQVINAWVDMRRDSDGDIFLQNINSDGAFGQLPIQNGYILGTVTGSDGTTPLQNAIVTTYDTLDVTVGVDTTTANGIYFLTLAPGLYHESFVKAGYIDTTLGGIAVALGETTHVAIALRSGAGNCHYLSGDVNDSHTFTGLDVVYAVAYLKGGPPPPYSCECTVGHSWYVSGDVNGSCSFTGLDVTYMVSFLKGGPVLQPCPDCPPLP